MDIDHFKKVIDTYGHDIGDDVLKFRRQYFYNELQRPFDSYGRWGGEEFIGIIRNITCQGLEYIGNRLRLLVEIHTFFIKNKKLHVTISIGATLVNDDDTIESLVKRADTPLYKSKNKQAKPPDD